MKVAAFEQLGAHAFVALPVAGRKPEVVAVRRGRHDRQSQHLRGHVDVANVIRTNDQVDDAAQRKSPLIAGKQGAGKHRERAGLRLDCNAGKRTVRRPADARRPAAVLRLDQRAGGIVALDADYRRLDAVDEAQRACKVSDLGMREVPARNDRHALVVMVGYVTDERVQDDIFAGDFFIRRPRRAGKHDARNGDRRLGSPVQQERTVEEHLARGLREPAVAFDGLPAAVERANARGTGRALRKRRIISAV